MKDPKNTNILNYIKDLLAKQLGIDQNDIDNDDSFIDDLRMRPTDLSDFTVKLSEEGYDISDLDFDNVDTVNDLSEFILAKQDI